MGSTVQKIENDDFSDDNFAVALMENVLDEQNVHDWSKFDPIVAKISKTICYSSSLFGTFDFDAKAQTSQAVEKPKRARRKTEIAEEKRPISVTQAGTTDAGRSKVETVLHTIKDVSILKKFILNIFIFMFIDFILIDLS